MRSSMYAIRRLLPQRSLIRLWAEAGAYFTYTLNRTLSRTRQVTPLERYYGKKPNIAHLRPFGWYCYVKTPDEDRRKLDPNGEKFFFLGYDETSTGYRVLVIDNFKIKISRDVVFDLLKTSNTTQQSITTPALKQQANQNINDLWPLMNQAPVGTATPSMIVAPVVDAEPPILERLAVDPPMADVQQQDNQGPQEAPVIDDAADEPGLAEAGPVNNEEIVYPGDEGIPTCANRRYPLRNRSAKVIQSMKATETVTAPEPFEPSSYREAMNCDEAHLW